MIYTLDHNIDHIHDEGVYDARLIHFEGWQDVYLDNPQIDYRGRVPESIELLGDLDALAQTDYPYLDQGLPLMSWKLLTALLSVAPFAYRAYPTRIYSDALTDEVRHPADFTRTEYEVTDPALHTERFVAVQLLNFTDVLDRERTIYAELVGDAYEPRRAAKSQDGYLDTGMVERLALTVSEERQPGLFAVPELFALLCGDQSVQACRAAGVVGVRFMPIPVPLYGGARDVEGGKRLLSAQQMPA